MSDNPTILRCAKDDHEAITAFAKKHGVNFDSAAYAREVAPKKLRCWKDDYNAVETFCQTYEMCYGEIVYDEARCSIFFLDVDGDQVDCCLTINSGNLKGEPSVKYGDIVFRVELNEQDLKTDVSAELLKYCLSHNLIKIINL